MVSDPLRVALRMAQIFESLSIPYLISGALASAILGEPRVTEDIDMDFVNPRCLGTLNLSQEARGHRRVL